MTAFCPGCAMLPEQPIRALPPDDHVHSEFSYDTRGGTSMLEACRRAVEIGLPGIAFTEHLDFPPGSDDDAITDTGLEVEPRRWWHELDVEGYLASIAECRELFPSLRVVSGIESGEPHWFSGSLSSVLGEGDFTRVLGSCHRVVHGGVLRDIGRLFAELPSDEVIRRYFAEVLSLAASSAPFGVLAHVDFVRRYVPREHGPYDELAYEEEYRAIFRVLAGTGRALELNTKTPLPQARALRWWYEAGGKALTFGSDAHEESLVGRDFALASGVAEAAGFRAGARPYDMWRR
jgi:histidinol-phosphatase (PHP family)